MEGLKWESRSRLQFSNTIVAIFRTFSIRIQNSSSLVVLFSSAPGNFTMFLLYRSSECMMTMIESGMMNDAFPTSKIMVLRGPHARGRPGRESMNSEAAARGTKSFSPYFVFFLQWTTRKE